MLRETLKVISAAHSVGGKEQLAVGVSEDRALGLAEMCGRCLVGSAARGEGVCVGGRGCVEAHVQEQKGFGLMERAPQLLTAE